MNFIFHIRINALLYFTVLCICLSSCNSNKKLSKLENQLETLFEQNVNYSASYKESIEYYKRLATAFSEVTISEFGLTDSGYPLHEVVISLDGTIDPIEVRKKGKTVLLINNAIHPGEPCGVDASMILARDIVIDKNNRSMLKDVVVVIIPFYNISGALNRGSYSRANQNGPEEYGFRGNVRHLDLNRDFVKCDTRNAETFNKLINKWKPQVMIDNHTSNGADYQYVMTLIATQKDQLNMYMSQYMTDIMLPDLYRSMQAKDFEMIPYVYARSTPDEGIAGFLDLPRYSSGYASLHNTISFMPETHMLKPYKDRVYSTLAFSLSVLSNIQANREKLMNARRQADNDTKTKTRFDLRYKLDYEAAETITFKGYEAKYKKSEVTGHSRLYYDQESPYEKQIPFYNTYKSVLNVNKPKAYIFPQAYHQIAERLQWNGVKVDTIESNKVMTVECYYIKDYKDQKAYEGHYLHYDVEVDKQVIELNVYKGDYIVYTDQISNNYIVSTLEPQHPDSFFAWNFMDGILMQKEHFSPYVFEELAAELLKSNSTLNEEFIEKKKNDIAFAEDPQAQLNWIYERSPYHESGHMRYPVVRLEK